MMNDRSLYDQLLIVHDLANKNRQPDAADWIMQNGIKPIQEKMLTSTHIDYETLDIHNGTRPLV